MELPGTLEEPVQCGGQPCTGGGPVTTWTYTEIQANNQDIIDSLQGYPCAQNILAKMPNLNVFTKSLLTEIFGVGPDVNVVFKPDDGNIMGDALGATPPGYENNGQFYVTVFLKPSFFKTATQEMILAVMLHESVHAYFSYQWAKWESGVLDSTFLKNNYPKIWEYGRELEGNPGAHIQMTKNYTLQIAAALKVYNSSLSSYASKALALNGLHFTPFWKTLGSDTVNVKNIWNLATFGDRTQAASYNLKKCMETITRH